MSRTAANPGARIHALTITLVCALMAIVIGWQLSSHISLSRVLWSVVLTAPLWLPLRGLMRHSRRTYAAMTLCAIPYFILGVTEALANPAARWWAGACLACTLSLFVALIGYLRLTRNQVEA